MAMDYLGIDHSESLATAGPTYLLGTSPVTTKKNSTLIADWHILLQGCHLFLLMLYR
jgi:hypothetical protein